jgi:hypothetical protein
MLLMQINPRLLTKKVVRRIFVQRIGSKLVQIMELRQCSFQEQEEHDPTT